MRFGLYLKAKGIISAEQLVSAIEAQNAANVPIGQLALEEGVLSAREIFAVLQAQSTSPQERFGDMAVQMGLMTRQELMQLLMIQADRRVPIARILVYQGALSESDAARELAAFRTVQLQPRGRIMPARRSTSAARRDERSQFDSDMLITV